jgi:hypothetical protein
MYTTLRTATGTLHIGPPATALGNHLPPVTSLSGPDTGRSRANTTPALVHSQDSGIGTTSFEYLAIVAIDRHLPKGAFSLADIFEEKIGRELLRPACRLCV